MKILFAAAAFAVLAIAPVHAADMLECNDASMQKVEMMIKDAMGKPEMKAMEAKAMEESKMAADMKAKGDMKACAMHLNMAQDSMMK